MDDVELSVLGSVIKTAYEAESDTNAFTDADHSKLDGVEAGATADQSGAEIKSLYEGEADTNAFTDDEKTKLASVESGATADQTGAQIKTLYEGEADTNAFTDAEQTKLSGIEDNATADQSDLEIENAYNNRVSIVSQVEAETGTETLVRRWTAQRVAQAIAALAGPTVGMDPVFKTANYTAVANELVLVDSSGGALAITLPATPSVAHTVGVFDLGAAATENITVERNGETIDGAAEDFVINEDHANVIFIYTGTTWLYTIF